MLNPHAVHTESLKAKADTVSLAADSIEEKTLEITCEMVFAGALDHLRASELVEALEQ